MATTDDNPTTVMIAIGPHEDPWTAAAVDAKVQPQGTLRVSVSRYGYRALLHFARRWPHTTWAIEGATGPGKTSLPGARSQERRC